MFALIIKKEITIQPLAVDAKSQKRLGRIIAFLNGIVKGKGDKMGAVHREELLSESSALRLAKYKVPYEIAKGVLPASFISDPCCCYCSISPSSFVNRPGPAKTSSKMQEWD